MMIFYNNKIPILSWNTVKSKVNKYKSLKSVNAEAFIDSSISRQISQIFIDGGWRYVT